jgi:hypothetical protein
MSTDYTTPAEDAATIRSILKTRFGWTSRDVSVRAESYSMGSSINVRIKNPTIPLGVVKAIATEVAEHIDYDTYSGEILSGGNRFVNVRYEEATRREIGAPYLDAVERAHAAVAPGSSTLMPVDGTPYLVGRPHHGAITLWGREAGMRQMCATVGGAAEAIGIAMLGEAS